jgi:DNA modification methylase
MTDFYQQNDISYSILKEQLRLFAFGPSTTPSQDIVLRFQTEMSNRDKLAALLEGELNFHGENSSYASHDLHAFAAKFPPQLPRVFIRGLSKPGDFVLDPMMGSGTTIVEAALEGRKGIGLDIDPLAISLSNVKTTTLDLDQLKSIGSKVIVRANNLLIEKGAIKRDLTKRFDERTKAFIDYWFLPSTQNELDALILAIEEEKNETIRRFLKLTFSSIIVTKSGGVSRARDLAHSRPHLDKNKKPRNAIEQFAIRFRKNLSSISQLKGSGVISSPIAGDARIMPFANNSIDLIVTSPPYANAIDYMRAHKFSLVWFGESISDLSLLRSKYIGSEKVSHAYFAPLSPKTELVISELAERDTGKASILRKYFSEMKCVLAEIHRVLNYDCVAIIVLGTSVMRGIDVQTHLCVSDIAASLGFDVVGVVQRILDRNKRMMPARFGKKSDSMIEQRMHEEYVIGLIKKSVR